MNLPFQPAAAGSHISILMSESGDGFRSSSTLQCAGSIGATLPGKGDLGAGPSGTSCAAVTTAPSSLAAVRRSHGVAAEAWNAAVNAAMPSAETRTSLMLTVWPPAFLWCRWSLAGLPEGPIINRPSSTSTFNFCPIANPASRNHPAAQLQAGKLDVWHGGHDKSESYAWTAGSPSTCAGGVRHSVATNSVRYRAPSSLAIGSIMQLVRDSFPREESRDTPSHRHCACPLSAS